MKKIISAVLVVVMLLSVLIVYTFAETPEDTLPLRIGETYTIGDVNSDGSVNAVDAYAIKTYVVSSEGEISVDAADFNADSKISSRDAFLLKGVLSGVTDISDYEGDSPIYSFTIASNNIYEYDIVVPEGTDPENSNVYLSARLMKTYISKGCGVSLSIVYGDTTKTHGIYYHDVEYGSKECEELKLSKENYKYSVIDGDLHIYGSVRGNMYATYEIIEEYLGFRFYSDSNTFIYESRICDIPEGTDVFFEVPYEFRFAGSAVANGNTRYSYYLAIGCNGTPCYSGGGKNDGYSVGPRFILGHSFGYFKNIQSVEIGTEGDLQSRLSDKYVRGNAAFTGNATEYNGWQPCCSEDESYYRMFNGLLEITQMIQSWGSNKYSVEAAKGASYSMTFSINDSDNYCSCRLCSAKVAGKEISRVNPGIISMLQKYYTGDVTISGNKVKFKAEGVSGLFLDFANRAAKEISTEYLGNTFTYGEGGNFTSLYALDPGIRTVYEDMSLNMIIYNHTVPESVKPVSNLQIMYVSHGCYNHPLGSGLCGDGLTSLGTSNNYDDYAIKEWGKMCQEAGASIWYYSHGINYACYLAPSPNILDFYTNAQYIRAAGFNGILYEGDSYSNYHANFENLKAYLAAKLAFNPDITYDEFIDMIKEYMYMYYGDGYEEVYEYMLMQTAAGDAAPCWTNNHDRPWDEYEPSYIKEHYEEMRNLLLTAIEKADEGTIKHCKDLFVSIEFLGLSASYKDMYTNGTASSKKTYEERYTAMYNYIAENNMPIYCGDVYTLPTSLDFSSDPMKQFVISGSWRGIEY